MWVHVFVCMFATMKVYMCFFLNDMLLHSMKVCVEGADTKEPLFDECILSVSGVHRQMATTEPRAGHCGREGLQDYRGDPAL